MGKAAVDRVSKRSHRTVNSTVHELRNPQRKRLERADHAHSSRQFKAPRYASRYLDLKGISLKQRHGQTGLLYCPSNLRLCCRRRDCRSGGRVLVMLFVVLLGLVCAGRLRCICRRSSRNCRRYSGSRSLCKHSSGKQGGERCGNELLFHGGKTLRGCLTVSRLACRDYMFNA